MRETTHYVKFRLLDEASSVDASRDEIRRRVNLQPPLLAWVARARLLGAITR